jgi:hypothetical protein
MKTTVRRGLAVALLAGALAPSAASAAPIEELIPSSTNREQSGQPAPVRIVQVSANDGFDWGDAGIGATGVLALVAIASGALVVARRRPEAGHSVA